MQGSEEAALVFSQIFDSDTVWLPRCQKLFPLALSCSRSSGVTEG